MSVWNDIDAMKAKFEQELADTRAAVLERAGKRAANSLKIREGDGMWRCLHDGKEVVSRTSAGLLEKLPKPKPGQHLR